MFFIFLIKSLFSRLRWSQSIWIHLDLSAVLPFLPLIQFTIPCSVSRPLKKSIGFLPSFSILNSSKPRSHKSDIVCTSYAILAISYYFISEASVIIIPNRVQSNFPIVHRFHAITSPEFDTSSYLDHIWSKHRLPEKF